MGLRKESTHKGNFTFVNFKEGELVANLGNGKETFNSIQGYIKELDITDETYNGTDYRKVTLSVVDDEGEEFKLGFAMESGYGNAFCRMARNIDFAKPVEISGSFKQSDNGKNWGGMFISQPDFSNAFKNVKWYYKKGTEENKKVPLPKEVIIGKKKVMDYSKVNDFFFKFLIDFIRPAIKKAWPDFVAGQATKEQTADNITAPIDDLPF